MRKYRLLYFGNWGYGKAGLEALLGLENVIICKVYSKWYNHTASPWLNQVNELATARGLSVVNSDPKVMSKEAFHDDILGNGAIDFIFSCCFDRYFPPRILKYPDIMAINMHPSLLPAYKGPKPLENAMADGERVMGVSLVEMVSEMDAGDILLQKPMTMQPEDTYHYLYTRQCELVKEVIVEFFQNPEKRISLKRAQGQSSRPSAPRLPFVIAQSDRVLDVMKKSRKFYVVGNNG